MTDFTKSTLEYFFPGDCYRVVIEEYNFFGCESCMVHLLNQQTMFELITNHTHSLHSKMFYSLQQ